MSRIAVIGSLNIDLVVTTPKVPVMGETVMGSGFMTVPGGKGANQAVAAAKLGGNVSMIGCVGNDTFAEALLDNLKHNLVDITNVKVLDGVPTGTATIVVHEGNNFIIVDPGANYKITPQMIDTIEDLIKESCIVVVQLEIPIEVVERVIDIANRYNVKVLLDPAPARNLNDSLLAKVDILTPNETECEILTGRPIKSVEDAKEAVVYLTKKGVQNVIITMGGNGVVYNSGKDIIHKSVPKVKVVDTTAAGDSFSGALAAALSQGKTFDEAIELGNIVGTLTVMKKGAQISLPSMEDVQNFRMK
jgi:ribokinase